MLVIGNLILHMHIYLLAFSLWQTRLENLHDEPMNYVYVM